MNGENNLKMLRYYRHDVMNELQLVQGYLYLEKNEKVKQKISEWINSVNEEGKLFLTDATQFIMWVIMFNHTYDNIRLTYRIETTANLSNVDHYLVKHCNELMQVIEKNCDNNLYYASLNIKGVSPSKIMFTLRVKGTFTQEENITNKLQNVAKKNKLLASISNDNSAIVCTWTYVI